MLGILLIDKPLGATSHDIVAIIRRRVGVRRVGHAGTLDPLATGLLVVAVGPATRFLQYLPLEPKEYVADIRFGAKTTTYDAEGEVVSEAPVPADLAGAIQAALPNFMGLIQQQPPMYSAVKRNGQPLYKLARQGVEVERPFRTIHISTFDIEAIDADTVRARIVCSGGTYIRSLAHDLGEAIGCGAHLVGLRRTGVGAFRLENASTLEDLSSDRLVPLEVALQPMKMVQLDQAETDAVRHGRQIRLDAADGAGQVALLEPQGRVFSVARMVGPLAHPECVIPEGMLDHQPEDEMA